MKIKDYLFIADVLREFYQMTQDAIAEADAAGVPTPKSMQANALMLDAIIMSMKYELSRRVPDFDPETFESYITYRLPQDTEIKQ
jgi:hypothetical protein